MIYNALGYMFRWKSRFRGPTNSSRPGHTLSFDIHRILGRSLHQCWMHRSYIRESCSTGVRCALLRMGLPICMVQCNHASLAFVTYVALTHVALLLWEHTLDSYHPPLLRTYTRHLRTRLFKVYPRGQI